MGIKTRMSSRSMRSPRQDRMENLTEKLLREERAFRADRLR